MDKTKLGKALSGGPIAEKVVAKMKPRMRSKIVNIRKVIESRTTAEELHKAVATQEELAGLDLAHAACLYTQNQVSVLSEQLTGLKEMGPFVDIISRAEGLYMPCAPPMSPLTTSYFTCWAFFDACAGGPARLSAPPFWSWAPLADVRASGLRCACGDNGGSR